MLFLCDWLKFYIEDNINVVHIFDITYQKDNLSVYNFIVFTYTHHFTKFVLFWK